ncbi:hypothetical protein Rhe02_81420 [Rhizocola hellebori]|uniref:GPP34 family phosphoprotein n=1 Tax=Rhizocola hellebori TaxID=1392758 RepID=A0A8J3VKS6_9ACTN|nr:GPP34 family phosphoprotein [Rhizocola hellebori]GIH10075.1 hypothetical protein Rhe02_81420 [Rhizocola hellebori]
MERSFGFSDTGTWTGRSGQAELAPHEAGLVATSLLLAAIDVRTGTSPIPDDALTVGLAAGQLAEMLLTRKITVRTGRVAPCQPPGRADELHYAELTIIGEEARLGEHHDLATWVDYLAQTALGRVLTRVSRHIVGHRADAGFWPVHGLDSQAVMWAGDRLLILTGASRTLHHAISTPHDAAVVMLADVTGLLGQLSALSDRAAKTTMAATVAGIPDQFASVLPWLAPLTDAVAQHRARRAVRLR